MAEKRRQTVVIVGAAGYDYHLFNTVYRDDPDFEVLAFSMAAEQNLGTVEDGNRNRYPPQLSGSLYPEGIPFINESGLGDFVRGLDRPLDLVVFAYSDVSHEKVMHLAAEATALGADFQIICPRRVQLKSPVPLLAVCAVRTGVGKSSIARRAVRHFKEQGLRVVAIREPMPYGDLNRQVCMRFASRDDLDKNECTVEEREEYEPYLEQGLVIYSGVDYQKVIDEASKEADVIVWDGGNNEISFYKPDLLITLADPLRAGHENKFHPGETNARQADVLVVHKCNSAKEEDIKQVESNLRELNKDAPIIRTVSTRTVGSPESKIDAGLLRGKRVVCVEDGPTTTHGGAAFGAAKVTADELGAICVNPVPHAVGMLKQTFEDFPHLKEIVPAMGYSEQQIKDLAETINNCADAELVLNGSPIDLGAVLKNYIKKPILRVYYDVEDIQDKGLIHTFNEFACQKGLLGEPVP